MERNYNVTICKTEGKNDIVATRFHGMKVFNLKQIKISQIHQLDRIQIFLYLGLVKRFLFA